MKSACVGQCLGVTVYLWKKLVRSLRKWEMHQVRIFFLLPLVGISSLHELMFFFSKSANNFQGNQKHCVKVPGLSVSIILVIFPLYTILKIDIHTRLKRLGGACRYALTWPEDFKIQNYLTGKVVKREVTVHKDCYILQQVILFLEFIGLWFTLLN